MKKSDFLHKLFAEWKITCIFAGRNADLHLEIYLKDKIFTSRFAKINVLLLILICMNKSELVAAIAAKAEITKVAAGAALDAAMDAIVEAMKKGDSVQLIGFGTFSVVEKAARKGINLRTKEAITIPARKAVKFKAGAKMAL